MLLRELQRASLEGRPAFHGRLHDVPLSLIENENKATRNSISLAKELSGLFESYMIALDQALREDALEDSFDAESRICEDLLEKLSVVRSRIRSPIDLEQMESKEEIAFSTSFSLAEGWVAPATFLERFTFVYLAANVVVEERSLERDIVDISSFCFVILRDLIYVVPDIGEILGQRTDFIRNLITSLSASTIHEHASVLCEAVLCYTSDPIYTLTNIPNLGELINGFNACQMVAFCRVLSCILVDPQERLASDIGKQLSSYDLLNQRRRIALHERQGDDVIAQNHRHLLQQSNVFIPRLVQLMSDSENEMTGMRFWLARSNSHWRPVQERRSDPVSIEASRDESSSTRGASEVSRSFSDAAETARAGILARAIAAGTALIKHVIARFRFSGHVVGLIMSWLGFASVRRRSSEENHVLERVGGDSNEERLEEAVIPQQDATEHSLAGTPQEDFLLSPTLWNNLTQRNSWLLTQRLDVSSVVSTLCIGPCKKEVQDLLMQAGMVDALIQRFDKLPWDPQIKVSLLPPSHRIHGDDCECDPNGAFKGQLLRLIHNVCDRESDNIPNKIMLLSEAERADLRWNYSAVRMEAAPLVWKAIDVRFMPLPVREETMNERQWQEAQERDALRRMDVLGVPGTAQNQRGLAWRVASLLVAGSFCDEDVATVGHHFWIFAALESLLRGSPRYLKMMVCSWGVLRAVIESVLKYSVQSNLTANTADVLQPNFDLLGELVKDNPEALAWICGSECAILGPPPATDVFAKVCLVALNHLIDGNVFLRSVVLTLRRSANDKSLQSARNWICAHTDQMCIGLWTVVSVSKISQESLCCLNTAVVLLTFARLDGKLGELVERLRSVDINIYDDVFRSQLPENSAMEEPVVCFRQLVWFWRCYYSCRQTDRRSLEYSSGIEFDEFHTTVTALCEPIPGDRRSLLTGTHKVHVPYCGTTLAVTARVDLEPWDRF